MIEHVTLSLDSWLVDYEIADYREISKIREAQAMTVNW